MSLERELEEFLSGIGFELVSAERGGGRRRPLLRLRVDRPDGPPGRGFGGRDVGLGGFGPLGGGGRQLVGRIVGLEGEAGEETVVLDAAGERVTVKLADVAKATLVYDFTGES